MFCIRLMKQFKQLRIRQLHSTFVKYEDKVVPDAASPKVPKSDRHILGSPLHTVSNFDKKILIWVKRYPSIDQIPDQIPIESIQKAYTQARIRVCFIMMGFSIIGFIASAMSGRKEVSAGKNMVTERMKWYKGVQEKSRIEAEAAKTQ